jgi:hypothetical protein
MRDHFNWGEFKTWVTVYARFPLTLNPSLSGWETAIEVLV